jgi:hypothetical protein
MKQILIVAILALFVACVTVTDTQAGNGRFLSVNASFGHGHGGNAVLFNSGHSGFNCNNNAVFFNQGFSNHGFSRRNAVFFNSGFHGNNFNSRSSFRNSNFNRGFGGNVIINLDD